MFQYTCKTTIVLNFIQIQLNSSEKKLCLQYDLDLGDMTLGQSHGTPLVIINNWVK